jgi:hypothetical protein
MHGQLLPHLKKMSVLETIEEEEEVEEEVLGGSARTCMFDTRKGYCLLECGVLSCALHLTW